MPENTGLVPDTGRFGVLDIFRFCYFAIPVPRISHPLDVRRQIPRSSPNLAACKHAIASAANGEDNLLQSLPHLMLFSACPRAKACSSQFESPKLRHQRFYIGVWNWFQKNGPSSL